MNLKCILLFIVLLAVVNTGFSQKPSKHGEKIESARIAFITDKINLTPEEAESFWPVFNEFNKEVSEIRTQKRLNPEKLAAMSDQEVEDRYEYILETDKKILEIKEKYFADLGQIIPTRKILLLQMIEREFKKELIQRMKKRRVKRKE